MPVATKLDRVVNYQEGLPPKKSHKKLDCVVLRDHMTDENNYKSTTRVAMTTKLGKMVAHLDGLFHKFMTTKPGRVLTCAGRVSTQVFIK